MPANNPRQPRRSWKDDKPTGGRPGQGQRGWHKEPAVPGAKGPMLSRRGKIALAASGLVLGIIAIAVTLWIIWTPDPPRFVLIRAGYETNPAVPENVAGVRGLDQIETWIKDYNSSKAAGRHTIDFKRHDITRDGEDPFDAALKGTTAETVVLYVAVHGAADSQGPYLIPNDADARKYAFYRLRNALTALKKLPAKTKKLLILDTTCVESDPTMSLLHNDFARALREDEKSIADVPNLAVLIASAEDQRSWISEEWGTSIFGHFVVEGLKGAAADRGVVTAQSLADYVSKQVEQWARDNRSDLQTPLLLGNKAMCGDFKLALGQSSNYQAPDPTTLPRFTAPDGLRAAWTSRDDLERSQPSPAVNAPHLWRQYLDSLKRYEDLLRANDSASAATMAVKLTELANRIKDLQRLQGDALANSLAMPKAFGWSLNEAELKRTEIDFNKLWTAKATANDYATKLKEWQDNSNDPLQRHLFRLRMSGLLLHKALESEADFIATCNILANAGVNDALSPYRPAEAHFALMLNRYLPTEGRNWAQTKKALEVRLQAEEAALGIDAATPLPAYSEQVVPWIKSETEKFFPDKPSVERADDFRGIGENLRFASARKAADADAATEKARQDYTLLQQKAAIVRQALAARDRAFAELPYYTTWLGTLPLSEADEKQYVDLWEKVHDLGDRLEKPAFDKIDALAKPAKEIDAEMNALAKKFKAALEVQADIQGSWHEINNLLQVPLIPAERRMGLLGQLRGTSYQLNAKKPSGLTGIDKAQHSLEQMRAAQRRGRLALAALGKDNPACRDAEPAITKPEEGAWGRSLARASERIAGAYYDMAVKAFADTEKGRQEPLKDARPMLRQAALQARQLSGAAAAAWPSPDPVWESHRVDVHDLLVYQGRRTFTDYWVSDDPKLPPYYRDAGDIYRSAAAAMAGVNDANLTPEYKKARLVEVDALAGLLAADDALTALYYDGDEAKPGPAKLAVTDENRVLRRFRLQKAPSAPPGFPVVWTTIDRGLHLATPQDAEHRALVKDNGEPDDGPITYVLIPDPAAKDQTKPQACLQTFTGFFRGREIKLPTKVTRYYLPDVTPYQPGLPKTAHLAVITNQRDFNKFAAQHSELVIVLDYSGSMDTPTTSSNGKKTRKQEALDALERTLSTVPEGVRVTILTFSQKQDNHQIKVQWGPARWDPSSEGVNEVIRKLRNLTPDWDTPLIRAIAKAKEQFTPGFPGAKTILVVTDGGDNEFNDPEAGADLRQRGNTMAKFLANEFATTNIQVAVLGFTVNEMEDRYKEEKNPARKKALEKEIAGLKEFGPAIKEIGGTFVTVADGDKLADQLKGLLMQIRYRVEGKENDVDSGIVPAKAIPADGAVVSTNQQNYDWIHGLEPGSFLVTLQTNRKQQKAIAQRVRLKGGDAMALQLQPDKNGQFVLRPEVWGLSYDIKDRGRLIKQLKFPPEADAASWLVSVVQNQRTDNGQPVFALHVMTAIENIERADVNATRETGLGIGRPPFVWFDVSANGSAGKPAGSGRRFYSLPNYPAPAYALDLPEWLRDQEPVLDVFWTRDAPPPCGDLRAENGKRLTDYKGRKEVRTLDQNDNTWLVVESITFEQRDHVEVEPGKFRDNVDCAVVRLRWDDPDPVNGKAFFALLPEGAATGWEQRIYMEAGKYTGVFFNVSEARLKALDHLTLYSVQGVKAKANRLTGIQLGQPNDRGRPKAISD